MKTFIISFIILGLFYLALLVYMYFFQERLIFLYDKIPQDFNFKFKQKFEERFFLTPGNGRINALHFKKDSAKGLILYSHGNKGTLSEWGDVYNDFERYGYDLLIYDYRKYGKSTGELTQATVLSDADYIYKEMAKEYGENSIVIYGRSLGSGISCYVAANNNPACLFLETPYHSLAGVGAKRYPFLPVRSLSKFPMPSFEFIKDVDCPIYIIHGTLDYVIPLRSAQDLYYEAGGKAEMVIIEGAGHNDLADHKQYHDLLTSALK